MTTLRRAVLSFLSTVCFALLLLALPLAAQAARLALVIGNDWYEHVERLKNAVNDARLMQEVLKRAGFEVVLGENLDREGLWTAVEKFKGRVEKGDEVVFFYAGHGVQVGSNQLLLPVDIRPRSEAQVQRDAVPLVNVQEALSNARVALLVIDACRDNPFAKPGQRTIGGTRGLQPPTLESGSGQIVMLSAGRNEKALDYVPGKGDANSLFTSELARTIQTPGLEVREALVQVQSRVAEEARKAEHKQTPTVVSELLGKFTIFVGPGGSVTVNAAPAQPAQPALTAEQIEDKAWLDAERANTVAAYEAYVAAYPKGRYLGVAQIRLALMRPRAAETTPQTAPAPAAAAAQLPPVQTARPQTPAPEPAPARVQASGTATASSAVRTERECVNGVCFEMVVVPAGRFMMGSNDGDSSERPVHEVAVRSFAIGKTEVTQALWQAVMGDNPSRFEDCGGDCPVERVSWDDAQQFVSRLSRATGNRYRLPSEAEWEYACRAGGTHRYCGGYDVNAVAWTNRNSGVRTQRVGGKQPNAWGLYDMSGNVWEWTEDCWVGSYSGAPSDGSAWRTGDCSSRVRRGGGWDFEQDGGRAAVRIETSTTYSSNVLGFRVARTLP